MTTPQCGTCRDCRFWQAFTDHDGGVGDCYRYPPTVRSISDYGDCETVNPMVHADHWCGEWQEANK